MLVTTNDSHGTPISRKAPHMFRSRAGTGTRDAAASPINSTADQVLSTR